MTGPTLDPLTAAIGIPLLLAFSYLLGSVPFGVVITRMLGLGDLRQIGSGNIGATNVLRTGHKGAALATLLLDSGKGAIAVILAFALGMGFVAPFAGLAAFLGHLYSVFLGFRGGKGVATYLGTLLAVAPLAGLLCCATWLAVALTIRISSASALAASVLAPVWLWLAGATPAIPAVLAMTALIWWKHRDNLARLRAGTEPKISLRSSGKSATK